MTRADWLALAFAGVVAFLGLRKGLVGSALSLAGVVAGALLGANLAPHLLAGDDSPYTPLVALAGAAFGAFVLETVGTLVGNRVRGAFTLVPPVRAADALGGLVLGAAAGLAVVWVAGAVALHLPGQTDLRRGAQRSAVLRTLNSVMPPARLMDALARVDPFPAIAGPAAPIAPPDPSLARHPVLARASANVVRVLGTACGLSVSGSGWIPRAGFVVTAAHVVAGQSDTVVVPSGEERGLAATAYAFDARNDVAVLRVPGLPVGGRVALTLSDPTPGESVAILGYPENRGLTAVPARVGRTAVVFSEDAYGRGPVPRRITSLRGEVRRGNSGGPAVNARGGVEATVFASRPGGEAGFGVPADVVRRALARASSPVSTGSCAG
jgi:hypothetical protein